MDPRQLRAEQTRRRRRVRRPAESDPTAPPTALGPAAAPRLGGTVAPPNPPGLVATTADAVDLVAEPELVEADTAAERGLRGLIGGGSSQVKPVAAMRARDAARPREADLARAEAELVVVRRNWTPRD